MGADTDVYTLIAAAVLVLQQFISPGWRSSAA